MNTLNTTDGLRARKRGEGFSGNRRRLTLATFLSGAVALLVTLVIGLCNAGSKVVAETVRHVGPPVARVATFALLLAAFVLAIAHYGAIGLDRGLGYTHGAIQTAHRESNDFLDRIWALVPRFEPSRPVPRATPVGEPDQPPVIERVASVIEGALFPQDELPQPANLPPIEGDILATAGGDRMQALITATLPAIAQVESSGRPFCVGDRGKAFGMYQVRHEPCEDIARIYGITIDQRQCDGNVPLSEYALRLYLGYWAARYEASTGEAATAEVLCRTWNGGPDMGPAEKTDGYWERCQSFFPEVAQLAAR